MMFLHYFWEPDVTFKRLDPVHDCPSGRGCGAPGAGQYGVGKVGARRLWIAEQYRVLPGGLNVRLTERKCMLPYATYISTYYLYFQRIWDFKKHLLLQTWHWKLLALEYFSSCTSTFEMNFTCLSFSAFTGHPWDDVLWWQCRCTKFGGGCPDRLESMVPRRCLRRSVSMDSK